MNLSPNNTANLTVGYETFWAQLIVPCIIVIFFNSKCVRYIEISHDFPHADLELCTIVPWYRKVITKYNDSFMTISVRHLFVFERNTFMFTFPSLNAKTINKWYCLKKNISFCCYITWKLQDLIEYLCPILQKYSAKFSSDLACWFWKQLQLWNCYLLNSKLTIKCHTYI